MDVAEQLVRFLVPQLPYLLDYKQPPPVTDPTATEQAKQIWQTLTPEVQARNVVQTAVAKLAANPAATDWQQILQGQLQEIFAARPDLAVRIEAIWQAEAAPASVGASAASISVNGNRNQTIGSISGQARAIGNVGGAVDTAQNEIAADSGSQIARGNASRSSSNFFSNNTVWFLLIAILALGSAAWMLAANLGMDGIQIETQGGEPTEQSPPE